ncbi:MAG: hypothetical protein KDM63_21635, partial [Verrucomicrobiae bacterium]|nr:hypothetical protein [Verrucomicrobiae bacterium]
MKSLPACFCLCAALATGPIRAESDLPEPPTSWKYPPEMPGAKVEVYREVGGVKLNAYVFEPSG